MSIDFEYVSSTLHHPVFPTRKPCFGWLSDDENSAERYDITKEDVKWVLKAGESIGGSRSIKSPRKVRFSDDVQIFGSDGMNSRMGGKYSDDINTRMGRKHSDNRNRGMGRKHSDDVNSRMGRKHSDEMNVRKDRKRSLQPTEKYSSYTERASPCSWRGYIKREPGRKDWNRVQNHGRQHLEQGVCYDVKNGFREWNYGQEDERHTEKNKSIPYNRRYSTDMDYYREKQRGIENPPKPHKSSEWYVKEPAHLRNDDNEFNFLSKRNRINHFQNSVRSLGGIMKRR